MRGGVRGRRGSNARLLGCAPDAAITTRRRALASTATGAGSALPTTTRWCAARRRLLLRQWFSCGSSSGCGDGFAAVHANERRNLDATRR